MAAIYNPKDYNNKKSLHFVFIYAKMIKIVNFINYTFDTRFQYISIGSIYLQSSALQFAQFEKFIQTK